MLNHPYLIEEHLRQRKQELPRSARRYPPGQPRPRRRAGVGGGLIGMRERIHAYGGDVQAGPRQPGGWTVSARLRLDGGQAR